MTLEEKIMTKKRFSKAVEELVAEKKLDYLDAMAYVVKQRGLDIRNVPKLLTPSLKEKLTAQVSKANLIRDKKQLKKEVVKKVISDSPVKISQSAAESAAERHESISKLNVFITEQDNIIEYLEKVEKIMGQMHWEIKNIIDINKMEQL